MANVVVLEPWYGGSHQAWLDGWLGSTRHDITTITMPAEFWKLRLRTSAVELAERFGVHLVTHGVPDLVVVSGMADLSTFAALTRRELGETPLALYLHENQLAYPLAPGQRPTVDLGLITWRSMLAADAIWWNSAFHRDVLLDELDEFFSGMYSPFDPRRSDLEARSTVLSPGVEARRLITADRPAGERPLVLWNQRWDHDKNPRAVFSALAALSDDGVDFGVALLGDDQEHSDVGEWVRRRLGPHIDVDGWLDRNTYLDTLPKADVVVSAADHEFFGMAIVEALAAGAVPVLPDRLSFPELLGSQWHQAGTYPDGELRNRLRTVLDDVDRARQTMAGLRESMDRYDVAATAAAHDAAVDRALAAARVVG